MSANGDRPRDPSTLIEAPEAGAAQLSLLVIGEGFVGSFTLPASGEVVVGRAADAGICIDRPNISRKHVRLSMGPPIRLADLGSANGTRVRNVKLAPGDSVEIDVGDVVELGSTMLMIQRRSLADRPHQVWTHGYFESRLDEECARAARSGNPFALVRLRVSGKLDPAATQVLLLETMRQGDVFAVYGPNEYEMLVFDASAEIVERTVRDACARLERQGAVVTTGIASYPADGRAAAQLMELACDRLRGAPQSRTPAAVPAMQPVERLMEQVAAGMINVLLVGETGVGKEVAAERIHSLSPRREKPLLRLNCAALSEALLESELFGHERGAFTGAVQAKPGLLESADGGTVFLDEIGDLPLSLQAKLLRVLEERKILRVGAIKHRDIDVRFIAATNRDLQMAMATGTFRRDLYYRLNGVTLYIAPLRERVAEIEPLARTFVAHACQTLGRREQPMIAPDALAALREYPWPGNIRELRNFMERAVLLCTGTRITTEHLPMDRMLTSIVAEPHAPSSLPMVAETSPPTIAHESDAGGDKETNVSDATPDGDRERILEALARFGGSQVRAAEWLGISRRTLTNRLNKLNLPRPRKGR